LQIVRIIRSERDQPDAAARGVALGFYDGMHRGHQQVVRTLAYLSAERGLRSCVYTFDAHPSTVIAGRENPEGYLCGMDERLRLIGESGPDEIYLQRFDRDLAGMEEEDFLSGILIDLLDARLVVIGYDFRFGRGRSGDAVTLQHWAQGHGIEVVVVDAFSLGGAIVSSTLIRRLVAQGKVEEASALLGRDYSLTGTVSPGRRLGSRLGFPTANISVPGGRVAPATGVYASRTRLDGQVYESVTNVGTRPTVDDGDTRLVIESFLLDRSGDFYGIYADWRRYPASPRMA
jgi:riboflavin kinase/FMN adenylyltransferase